MYLNQSTRREFLSVNDHFGAIPERQSITKEDDAPQIALKHSDDGPLFHTPVLSLLKVPVIPDCNNDN